MKQSKSINPFFIVGSGRSGSTLLRMILSSNSKISIPPETWVLIPLVASLPLTKPLNEQQLDQALNIIFNHYRWPDFQIDELEFANKLKEMNAVRIADIMNTIYEYYLIREGKEIIGDKTPPYINIVGEINKIYPNAKIIHLVRDGHDVTMSFHDKGWGGRLLYQNAQEWKNSIKMYNKIKKSDLSNQVITIDYESLVMKTEETIKVICDFIGVQYEQGMLEWAEKIKEKIPDREKEIHKKLFRKPNQSDVYKWRKDLSLLKILIIESFIGKELKSMNYDLKFNELYYIPLLVSTRLICSSITLAMHAVEIMKNKIRLILNNKYFHVFR